MKKIALLFTIVCAGQLFGMEPNQKMGAFGELPEDVYNEIIKHALTSNYTLGEPAKANEEIKEAIKVAGALRGVRYDNLKAFTKLVHILADKFGLTTAEVALKFKTPASKSYYNLGYFLLLSINQPDEVTQLIRQGADVNFNCIDIDTPLNAAIGRSATTVVKLLLDAGANLTPEALDKAKSKAELYNRGPLGERALAIKEMLEEAMKKQQMENQ